MGKAPEARNNSLSAAGAELVEGVCLRFQAACRAEPQPRIEVYLAEAPPAARSVVLRRLLLLEFAQRGERGETVVLDEYCKRFPGDAELIDAAFREAAGAHSPRAANLDSAPSASADTNPERVRA